MAIVTQSKTRENSQTNDKRTQTEHSRRFAAKLCNANKVL